MTEEIKNIENLLVQFIEPHEKVVSFKIDRLTPPGENYLSLVLKLDVILSNEETGKQRQFSGVAKCFNPREGNEEEFKEFETGNYKSELTFYKEIIPLLKEFTEKKDLELDIFPKMVAYRSNLHGKNDNVDGDGVILLENMKIEGFRNMDRHVGVGLEDAKVILKDLSLFHSVPVALKVNEVHIFNENIRKNLKRNPYLPFECSKTEENKILLPLGDLDVFFDILENNSLCNVYIENLRKKKEYYRQNLRKVLTAPKTEPLATISHNDMWVNNTMQIFEGDRIVKNKFVDFQVYTYDSPVQDLLFFIGTSVQLPVIVTNFDSLIKFYHENFLEYLGRLGCNKSHFAYDKFEEELRHVAWKVLFDVIMFLPVVLGKKGEESVEIGKDLEEKHISDVMRERAANLVHIFGKRGWI